MPSVVDRMIPWLLRAIWVAVLVAGGPAIDSATASSPDAVGLVARFGALAVWTVGVAAMAVPAVASLTAVRLVVPLATPAAVVCLLADGEPSDGLLFLTAAVLAALLACSAVVGRLFVQASAYGAEDRHLLRPPAAYLLAAVITWAIWASLLLAAPLLLAHERWFTGAAAGVGAVAGAVLGWPRWHRLTRRWFVIVPIGVVIHDELVLAETVMLRRQELSGIRLAPAQTEAADLTGPAAGHALEIETAETTTVILAATPKQPRGTAIHLRACLIAPSRPGQALVSAAARRMPVG